MGYSPYSTQVLIPRTQSVILSELSTPLLRRWAVAVSGNTATARLANDGYTFALSLEEGQSVRQENQEILELLGLPGMGADYPQRLHWWGTSPDPDMDHFNAHVFLLEAVSEFIPEGIFFDSQGGERIEV